MGQQSPNIYFQQPEYSGAPASMEQEKEEVKKVAKTMTVDDKMTIDERKEKLNEIQLNCCANCKLNKKCCKNRGM